MSAVEEMRRENAHAAFDLMDSGLNKGVDGTVGALVMNSAEIQELAKAAREASDAYEAGEVAETFLKLKEVAEQLQGPAGRLTGTAAPKDIAKRILEATPKLRESLELKQYDEKAETQPQGGDVDLSQLTPRARCEAEQKKAADAYDSCFAAKSACTSVCVAIPNDPYGEKTFDCLQKCNTCNSERSAWSKTLGEDCGVVAK